MNTETDPNIVDSFLDELLGRKTPPDLRSSISKRLATSKENVPADWDNAIEAASVDLEQWSNSNDSYIGNADTIVNTFTTVSGSGLSAKIKEAQANAQEGKSSLRTTPEDEATIRQTSNSADALSSVSLHSSSDRSQSFSRKSWSAWAVAVALTTAAALLVVGGLRWMNTEPNENNHGEKIADVPKGPGTDEDMKGNLEIGTPNGASDTQIVAAPQKQRVPQIESLEMDKVPFLPKNDKDQVVASDSVSNELEAQPKSSDVEVVKVIDEQFASLWKRAGLQLPEPINTLEWSARAVKSVLGREPSESELEAATSLKTSAERIAWLQSLTNTPEFAQHWGRVVGESWLGRTANNDRDEAFFAWVGSGIQKGTSLAELQRELLLARGTDDQAEAEFNPATHWMITASSGGTNHLVDRLGRLLLGQQLMCARCHDEKSVDIARSTYWGVNAVFAQLDFYVEDRTQNRFTTVSEGPRKDLFYERDNGTQALAIPAFPDGKLLASSATPSSVTQFADWFSKSGLRSAQNVNIVWDALFSQPLVPLYGLSNEEGATERNHLRDFLTQQFVANEEQLSTAIVWMVASQPFGMPAASPFTDVALGTDAFQTARLQHELFASFSPGDMKDSESRQARMRLVAEWLQSNNKILSQPAPNQPIRNQQSDAFEIADQDLRRVLNSPLPDQVASNIDAWVAKKMKADLLLEHAVILCDAEQLPDETFSLAKSILEQSESKKQTLTRLIKAYGVGL